MKTQRLLFHAISSHIFTGGLLAELACHVHPDDLMIKQSNVHTHRQSDRILRPFAWDRPQSYDLQIAVAEHSSPCPYLEAEKTWSLLLKAGLF